MAARVPVCHQSQRSNQCTGSAATAQIRPSWRTARGAPAGVNRLGERMGQGADLFRYYQDLISLRRSSRGLRSRNIDIIHASNDNRVIAFTRNDGTTRELVVASLNNRPFDDGYVI